MSLQGRPTPNPTAEMRPFWEALRDRQFVLPQCRICGAWRWPLAGCRDHPNEAFLGNLKWTPASGKGKVFAFTIHHVAFHPAFQVPYVYALIELEEGPVMVSNVVGCDPRAVLIGLPVRVTFRDVGDSYTLPLFEPDVEETVQ